MGGQGGEVPSEAGGGAWVSTAISSRVMAGGSEHPFSVRVRASAAVQSDLQFLCLDIGCI
jgi:hypothetical protein